MITISFRLQCENVLPSENIAIRIFHFYFIRNWVCPLRKTCDALNVIWRSHVSLFDTFDSM